MADNDGPSVSERETLAQVIQDAAFAEEDWDDLDECLTIRWVGVADAVLAKWQLVPIPPQPEQAQRSSRYPMQGD